MSKQAGHASGDRERVAGRRYVAAVRKRRHRVAMLEALADAVTSMFTTARGGTKPEYTINDGDSVELPDINAVLEIETEIRALAEKERARLEEFLNRKLVGVTTAECPPLDEEKSLTLADTVPKETNNAYEAQP